MRFLIKYLILSALFFTLFELKAQIKPILIENDTSVINKSSFKVYKLFDEKDIKEENKKLKQNVNIGDIAWVQPYQNADTLILMSNNCAVKVMPNGTIFYDREYVRSNYKNIKLLTEIKYLEYKIFRKESKYMGVQPEYIQKKEKIKVNNYNLIVDIKKPLGCGSCGNNPVTIKDKMGKTLLFKNIQNLTIFECDIDNDKKNEIYVASYDMCEGTLVVYQVVE